MRRLSEKKLRIKGLGIFKIGGGNEIQWYKDKEKKEAMSGVIRWYSWKDKQIEIKGDDGAVYLMEIFKDPETGKWRYRVKREPIPNDEP